MRLAKVVGSVVSTQKSPSLIGKKLLLVRQSDAKGNLLEGVEVAVDVVGAGEGELVMLTTGSAARRAIGGDADAVNMAIVAIVDSLTYLEE